MSPRARRLPFFVSAAVVLILSALYWKFRILDHGTNPTIEIGPVDLYIEVIPTFEYAFSVLKSGDIPLWNPYQFCGEPFLAIGYTGLFYPPHLIMLFVDVMTSNEILFIFHMFLGAMGMWLLMRNLGVGSLGGLCASMTFTWSGWMILNNTLPMIMGAMCWLPLIILFVDGVARGRPFAWLGLILALACQILLGAIEICLHTLYLGALFTLCRLIQLGWRGEFLTALTRGGLAAACVAAAVLLAMPQLLPAIELAMQSVRAPGSLTLTQVVTFGTAIPPGLFAWAAIGSSWPDFVTVGALPLVSAPLALAVPRERAIWITAIVAATAALLLIFGGPVFHLYYEIPVVGGMFRRPSKFLDIYCFGQALLVGAAIARLEGWAELGGRYLWSRPTWLVSWLLGLTGLVACLWAAKISWWWVAMLGLLTMFGLPTWPRLRVVILVGLCTLQGANLFFTTGDTHVRPVKRPEIYRSHQALFDWLKANLGDSRVYISPGINFFWWPGLTSKQGLLQRMAVSIDYEPLSVARYEKFFGTVSALNTNPEPFYGPYWLGPDSRWRVMDLTGTRYFLMIQGEPGEVFMTQHPADFQPKSQVEGVRVFEKREVLPRAYFVARARALAGPDEVLAMLDSPDFHPESEVLLEEPVESLPSDMSAGVESRVTIASYAPERVVLSAQSEATGYLVLGDLFYPGWKAFVGGREVPIYRANYLFRAVRLDAGSWEVRFEYHPDSFRLGVLSSGLTAAAILLACLWARRRSAGVCV